MVARRNRLDIIVNMGQAGNIVIGDSSAEFFLMHDDAAKRIEGNETWANPLHDCAGNTKELTAFNSSHPLLGGRPVTLLVPSRTLRRVNPKIVSFYVADEFPAKSFFELRDGLYMAAPECAFLLAARHLPLPALVALGVNLCGRYYLAGPDDEIRRRSDYLTTPDSLLAYVKGAERRRGAGKAKQAVGFVTSNSGSPAETQAWVQYCVPMRYGGMGLGFTHMNYDVKAGRLAQLTTQSDFCIDIVDARLHFGVEFDGKEYHQDAGKDKRRRNDLKMLGWDVYPIDGTSLYNPDETIRTAKQLARIMGKRFRPPKEWEKRYVALREFIGLPA